MQASVKSNINSLKVPRIRNAKHLFKEMLEIKDFAFSHNGKTVWLKGSQKKTSVPLLDFLDSFKKIWTS